MLSHGKNNFVTSHLPVTRLGTCSYLAEKEPENILLTTPLPSSAQNPAKTASRCGPNVVWRTPGRPALTPSNTIWTENSLWLLFLLAIWLIMWNQETNMTCCRKLVLIFKENETARFWWDFQTHAVLIHVYSYIHFLVGKGNKNYTPSFSTQLEENIFITKEYRQKLHVRSTCHTTAPRRSHIVAVHLSSFCGDSAGLQLKQRYVFITSLTSHRSKWERFFCSTSFCFQFTQN